MQKVRKVIAIIFYMIAGLIVAASAYVFAESSNSISLIEMGLILLIIAIIGIVFFALAAWIHPSKRWRKHTAITISITTIVAFLGNINNYFVLKGMGDLELQTDMVEQAGSKYIDYNWTSIVIGSVILLVIAYLLFKSDMNKEREEL